MWFKILQVAINLVLKFTRIPPIEDEVAFRDFCKELVAGLRELAEATPIEQDDEMVAVLDRIVYTDTYWAAFYRVLIAVLELIREEKDDEVFEQVTNDPGVVECCDECGCDKHLFCRLLCFVGRLWRALRRLRG